MTATLPLALLLASSLSSAAYADCEGLKLPHSYSAESQALYIFATSPSAAPEVHLERRADNSVHVRVDDTCARYEAATLSYVFVYAGDAADPGARRMYAAPVDLEPIAASSASPPPAASVLARSTATEEQRPR